MGAHPLGSKLIGANLKGSTFERETRYQGGLTGVKLSRNQTPWGEDNTGC